MAESSSQQSMIADEHIYVHVRWAFVVVLLILYFMGVDYPRSDDERWMHLLFWVLFLVDSIALSVVERRDPAHLEKALRFVIAPDLVAVTGFTYLFSGYTDGFYPFVLLISTLYALVMPKRDALAVGMASAAAYLIGHYIAHRTYQLTAVGHALHVIGVMAVVLLCAMVATSVERRRVRADEAHDAILARERALKETRQRVAELQAVSEITEMIHSTLDFERVGSVVLEILAKVIGVQKCCLLVVDKRRSETLFSASSGTIAEVPSYRGGEIDQGDSGSHFSCFTPFDHAEMMVLFCASPEDIERLSPEDRLVLSAVTSELVVAVENSRLYKLTKRLATTDELTGLANYRRLQVRLEEEIERARRYERHFSLLMLDVDEFKGFNDRYGHMAGDAALADLARVIEQVVREVDLVARYGGEEFALVLPETDAVGAFVVAEKIRESVAEYAFADADGERRCHLTVSIGLSTYPTHGTDRESLLREADEALYRAKTGGRDRVRAPARYEMNDAMSVGRTLPVVPESDEPREEVGG